MPGPRTVAAVALTVLAACGVLVLVTPLGPRPLVGRSNWQLSTALPARADFPAEWNYSVYGPLGYATVAELPKPNTTDSAFPLPTATYTPAGCGDLPDILSLPGTPAANVHVDRDTTAIRQAKFFWPGAEAAGYLAEDFPEGIFTVTSVRDGPALITGYLDWLRRCDAYRVSIYYPDDRRRVERFVHTTVDAHETVDDETAVAVTRTFADLDGGDAGLITYHVSYYTVRGLLLEGSTNMTGEDGDLVKRLTGETVRKLRAL